MYSSMRAVRRLIRSPSSFWLKFRSVAFTALNLLPSIAASSLPYKPRFKHILTNARNTFFNAAALSFRNRDIVL
jgi:hypothetical protein